MKILKENINLENTLMNGQVFRVTKEDDSSYTIVINDRVINIKDDDNYLVINSNKLDNLESVIKEYFDLNRDYESINKSLLDKDITLKEVISFNHGHKVLRQDKFEMFISYIISQNNNVKRISNTINYLSKKYGTKVNFNDNDYYLFPTYAQIKNITLEELRLSGVGFRDKYIINALNVIKDNPNFLSELDNMETVNALNELMKIKGIGKKVASCILLFGYGRFDVFPIDTWVRKYVSKIIGIKDDINVISEYMSSKYGKYSGLVIQYFYNFERNK